jgi:hypothetical protein
MMTAPAPAPETFDRKQMAEAVSMPGTGGLAERRVPADEAAKLHGPTWGDEMRTYEFQKRRTVDPDLLKGPAIRVTHGAVRAQERVFDPVVQRFRDPDVELYNRSREENARVGHLNRAHDIQILREQPWNVLTNASRLEGVDQGIDPVTLTHTRARHGRSKMPDTFVDYNILSNLNMEEHHWAPPDERPVAVPKEPRNRKIPAYLQKDYNVVNNRYLHDHEQQLARDKELNKLQATAKFRERNRFNPLTQQYTDGDENLRMRTWEESHKIEAVEKAQAQMPPSIKHRPSAYWNVINHRQANADTLKMIDLAEDERKERYKNRYIVENNLHARDISSDQIENERRLNRMNNERFAEPLRRGYDIVTHDAFQGQGSKPPYLPFTTPAPDVWERVQRSNHVARAKKVEASATASASATQIVEPTTLAADTRSNRSAPAQSTRSMRSEGNRPADAVSNRSRRSERARSERAPSGRGPSGPMVPMLQMPGAPQPPAQAGAGSAVYSQPM